MQPWKEKHGKRVVSGGALRGMAFDHLTTEQLTKAAKRYPCDPKLHKYARAVLASLDLDGNEPEPCRPVLVRASQSSATVHQFYFGRLLTGGWTNCPKITCARSTHLILFGLLLIFVLKPAFSTACARFAVQSLRLLMRRVAGIVALLLEGLIDEVIYQLELVLRQALPEDLNFDEMARSPSTVISHLLSALTGATLSLLTSVMHARRGQIPAAP